MAVNLLNLFVLPKIWFFCLLWSSAVASTFINRGGFFSLFPLGGQKIQIAGAQPPPPPPFFAVC